jgi:Arc/MetJ family transcription regulator
MSTIAAIKQAEKEYQDKELVRRALQISIDDAEAAKLHAAEIERNWANSIHVQREMDDLRAGMRTPSQQEWDDKYDVATRTLKRIGLEPSYPTVKIAHRRINAAMEANGLTEVSQAWTKDILKRLVDNGKATEYVDSGGVTHYKLL